MADESATPAVPAPEVKPESASKLVASDSTPPPQPAAEPENKTKEAAQPTPAAEPAKPAEGTPDKVLQQIQQKLAANDRQLAELLDRVTPGEELSEADAKRLEKIQERRGKIQQDLTRYAGEGYENEAALREQLLEDSERLDELDQSHRANTDDLRQRIEELEGQLSWQRAESKYDKVNVQQVWTDAVEDAEKLLTREMGGVWESMSEDQRVLAVRGRASTLWNERCHAAQERANNKTTTPTQQAGSPQATAVGGTRTVAPVVGAPPVAPDPIQQQLARARRLVRPET